MTTSRRYSPDCLGRALRPMSSMMSNSGLRYLRTVRSCWLKAEVADQVENGTVEHLKAGFDGFVAQALGQGGLAHAGRAQEEDVFGFTDEVTSGQGHRFLCDGWRG